MSNNIKVRDFISSTQLKDEIKYRLVFNRTIKDHKADAQRKVFIVNTVGFSLLKFYATESFTHPFNRSLTVFAQRELEYRNAFNERYAYVKDVNTFLAFYEDTATS